MHRLTNKLSIRDAQKKTKVSKGIISRIEHGEDMTLSTLTKIVRAYGLRLDIHFS